MPETRIVPFKKKKGISDELFQRLLEKSKEYDIHAIHPLDPDTIMIAEWVNLKCRYGCSRYNTNWSCPPATPGPEQAQRIISEYSLALLLVGVKNYQNFCSDNTTKRAVQVRCWKGTIVLERMLFLSGYYKAFSLVGECCGLCKQCSFPQDCRFPQEKRPSVESFSIDVIGTLQNLGLNSQVAVNKTDTFNYYGIILLE
jgi:predicted metal-binding protein